MPNYDITNKIEHILKKKNKYDSQDKPVVATNKVI